MPVQLLSLLLNKNVLQTLGIALLGISVYFYGYHNGKTSERTEWQAAQTQVLENQLKEIERQKQENAKLVAEYQKVEQERNTYYRKLKDEVAKNTSGTQCFGAGAVRVWNEAIGSTRDLPRASTGTPKAPAASSATDRDILGNAVKNFEQYKECRDLHDKLREWRDKNFGGE